MLVVPRQTGPGQGGIQTQSAQLLDPDPRVRLQGSLEKHLNLSQFSCCVWRKEKTNASCPCKVGMI